MAKKKEQPVSKEFRFSGSPKRLKDEDFEEYKERRKMLKALEKQKLIMESTKDQATIEQKLKKEIDKDHLEKQKLIMESAKDQAIIEQKQEAAEGKQAIDLLTKLNKGEKDA